MTINSTTFDPIQIWKSWYEAMEQTWGKSLDEWVKTEEYTIWIGEIQKWFFYTHENYKKTVDQILAENNIPSKKDISTIAQLIIQLEEKIEKLDERLDSEVLPQISSIKSNLPPK
jgi:polyhydroxyalkanoic acid synthase PhaR subunit